jgi:hypothetical protein
MTEPDYRTCAKEGIGALIAAAALTGSSPIRPAPLTR